MTNIKEENDKGFNSISYSKAWQTSRIQSKMHAKVLRYNDIIIVIILN